MNTKIRIGDFVRPTYCRAAYRVDELYTVGGVTCALLSNGLSYPITTGESHYSACIKEPS